MKILPRNESKIFSNKKYPKFFVSAGKMKDFMYVKCFSKNKIFIKWSNSFNPSNSRTVNSWIKNGEIKQVTEEEFVLMEF